MKKYLAIGTIVQTTIIVLRTILGKTQKVAKENKLKVTFWIGVIVSCMINIVVWPLSIISEIYLTIKGL